MRKIIGKKNKVHYVEETTRFQMVKSHKGWLVICASTFALGSGMLVTSRPVSAEVATTSTSSSAVNAETTNASSSSAVNAETTSASSSSAVNADLTLVTKDNFLDYFSLNGSATYDQNTGIVTITPDENNKVGNFSLKSKIDMNSSFTLTGQVNIGNKTSSQGGADGVGFAFHNGNTTDVGNAGGNLGIAGLQDAIGFKLDTWHNDNFTPQATVPGAQVSSTDSDGFGWSQDPSDPQFGAFVTTDSEEIKAKDEKPYQRWWATTDMSSVKGLSSNDLDGNFHNFVVSYDGQSRLLTINYTEASGNVLTWTKEVDSSYQAMAMIISASTGGAKNLQQFKITSFDFKQAATVNVKYVDTKGNQIAQGEVTYPNGANVNGTYSTTQLDIPGYTFIKMGDGSLSASGTLTQEGDNGTVTYVYTKDPVAGGNVTAKYVDENGNQIADNVVSSGNVGDPYSTTQKDVPGYTFKEVQGNPTGSFTDQDQTVTYVYTKDPVAGGNVTAKYVDENGNPIADDVVSSGNVGDPYSTTQKDVPGYTFKEVQGNPTGSFTDQDQTVTYVYTKDPVAGGNVTAKYVDENGNPIADDVVSSGNVGDPYSTTQKDVPGYTFKEVQGNPTGSFTDQDQTVTYVYTKDPVAGGNVTVKYVDGAGNTLSDNVVKSGNIGDDYSTEQKDIPGYTFKEVQGSASGQFTDQEQTVTYVYAKNAPTTTSTTTVEPTTTVAATTTTVEPTTTAAATTTTVEPTTTVAATTTTVEPTTTVAATTTTVEPTTTASTSTTTVEPTTTVAATTTTVEPTTTVAATTTTVEPTTTASTSTTTVEPTTTVSTSTTTVEPTTTVAATTTTVEPTTTAAATTTTVEPTTTVAATTTTVEPTTTVAATTTTVEPTTTAAATTTTASTTTVAPTTSVTTTAATTVDVPGTTTGVTPPPAGGKKGRTLPKTGEESGLTTSLVGFALMSVASVAAVLYRKSKKA